jgi:hypothetical protein
MINPKYLPDDFIFRDPSKMKKAHYQALLEHWYERQQNAKINTVFEFKGYWDPSSESVLNADDGFLARRTQLKPKRTNPGATKNRPGPPGIRVGDPGFTSDSSSSDEGEEDEGENEDDEDSHSYIAHSKKAPVTLPFSAVEVSYRGARAAKLYPHGKRPKMSKSKNQALPPPTASSSSIPKKPRRPRYLSQPPDLGPGFERPATRHGGKRKAEVVGLPETKERPAKKVKRDEIGNGRKRRS